MLAFLAGDGQANFATANVDNARGSNVPPGSTAAAPTASSKSGSDIKALTSFIAGAHLNPDLGQRAIYAYRHSTGAATVPLDLMPAI